jgi:hypothetical protein
MREQCSFCRIALWYHRADEKDRSCPAHAGRMDWLVGCRFIPSGTILSEDEVIEQGHQNTCWGEFTRTGQEGP